MYQSKVLLFSIVVLFLTACSDHGHSHGEHSDNNGQQQHDSLH